MNNLKQICELYVLALEEKGYEFLKSTRKNWIEDILFSSLIKYKETESNLNIVVP